MKKMLVVGCASLFIVAIAGARGEPAQSSQKTIPATLLKSIDAQKTRTGDEVSALTGEVVKAEGRIIVPKGSKLMGHIVEVKERSDDQPISQIVLTFDRAVLKDGKEIPLTASIASISRPQGTAAPSDAGAGDLGVPSSAAGGTSATPKEGHAGGGTAGPAEARGNEKETQAAGAFTLQQRASRTVISSNSENVHLASGTQLLLQVKTRE